MTTTRPLSDYVAMVALVLSAALLCLVVYQDGQITAANEALGWVKEHCILVIRP